MLLLIIMKKLFLLSYYLIIYDLSLSDLGRNTFILVFIIFDGIEVFYYYICILH